MNPAGASTHDTIVQEMSMKSPADRIFEALTNPSQLVSWWGVPGKFRVTHAECDLRAGGKWSMRLDTGGGKSTQVSGVYRRVERPRLLEFTWIRDSEDLPETLVRWDLEELDGVTHVRLTHSGLNSEALRNRNSGWPLIFGILRSYAERENDAGTRQGG
jgi:uncharacterized protein YndB with AHSA1/START domain